MITFEFIEIDNFNEKIEANFTDGCSGGRSDCCTRVCTKAEKSSKDIGSKEEWDKYLEIAAGVLQY